MTNQAIEALREQACLAEEWQRDGRGLWAMRACHVKGKHGRHVFTGWTYNVQPPGSALSGSGRQAQAKDKTAGYCRNCELLCGLTRGGRCTSCRSNDTRRLTDEELTRAGA